MFIYKSDHTILPFKIFQLFSTSLRIKARVLKIAYKVQHELHSSFLVTPLTSFTILHCTHSALVIQDSVLFVKFKINTSKERKGGRACSLTFKSLFKSQLCRQIIPYHLSTTQVLQWLKWKGLTSSNNAEEAEYLELSYTSSEKKVWQIL